MVLEPIASVTADGAYDADVVYDEIEPRHPEADVIIPPRSTAVVSESGTARRLFRYKTIIGRRLRARSPSNQKSEAKIRCAVLNRMTGLGMPISVRIK
jgi:hypothetical protein